MRPQREPAQPVPLRAGAGLHGDGGEGQGPVRPIHLRAGNASVSRGRNLGLAAYLIASLIITGLAYTKGRADGNAWASCYPADSGLFLTQYEASGRRLDNPLAITAPTRNSAPSALYERQTREQREAEGTETETEWSGGCSTALQHPHTSPRGETESRSGRAGAGETRTSSVQCRVRRSDNALVYAHGREEHVTDQWLSEASTHNSH